MQSISIGLLLLGLLGPKVTPPRTWRSLAPGMDLAYVGPGMTNSPGIAVLRIDLKHWELEVMGSSRTGESGGHTAREWCETHRYTAAINAGMFATDARTHLGYLRFQGHVNNQQGNAYQSVAAFDPREPGSAVFRIFDLDAPGISLPTILKNYAGVVQNLRLIKRPGLNQWGQQTRQWSEAALGEDDAGRALFIFARTPYSMHDLNRELMAAGIGRWWRHNIWKAGRRPSCTCTSAKWSLRCSAALRPASWTTIVMPNRGQCRMCWLSGHEQQRDISQAPRNNESRDVRNFFRSRLSLPSTSAVDSSI